MTDQKELFKVLQKFFPDSPFVIVYAEGGQHGVLSNLQEPSSVLRHLNFAKKFVRRNQSSNLKIKI